MKRVRRCRWLGQCDIAVLVENLLTLALALEWKMDMYSRKGSTKHMDKIDKQKAECRVSFYQHFHPSWDLIHSSPCIYHNTHHHTTPS